MKITPGDIYWPKSKETIPHPYVIINNSDLTSLKVVTLTTNQNKATMPGVVILEIGEANLEKPSIVEVYNVLTINQSELGEYIGTLSEERVQQILNGMRFVKESFLNSNRSEPV